MDSQVFAVVGFFEKSCMTIFHSPISIMLH